MAILSCGGYNDSAQRSKSAVTGKQGADIAGGQNMDDLISGGENRIDFPPHWPDDPAVVRKLFLFVYIKSLPGIDRFKPIVLEVESTDGKKLSGLKALVNGQIEEGMPADGRRWQVSIPNEHIHMGTNRVTIFGQDVEGMGRTVVRVMHRGDSITADQKDFNERNSQESRFYMRNLSTYSTIQL